MRSKLLYTVVLIAVFFLDAMVIYVFTDPVMRVTLALLFLLPIVWAADALGIADMISDLPRTQVRHRQCGALRSNVGQILDVVRRLNWLSVDLKRGIRPEDEVKEEMDQAYGRLQSIVDEIRDTVGRASADPEVLAEPNLLVDRGPSSQDTVLSVDEAPGEPE